MPQLSAIQQIVRNAIQTVAVGPNRGRDISRDDARQIAEAMLRGEIDEVQLAVLLIGLRMKSESPAELAGLFDGLKQEVSPVTADIHELFVLAEPFDGYLRCNPVTPFIPPVLAACGMPSVIHGVHSLGPKFGLTAHQVYLRAGIDVTVGQSTAAGQLSDCGWAYIDQQSYAPALYALSPLRDRIVKRTALTTLERVLPPLMARVKTHLVLGYVHKAYPEVYCALAHQAGYTSALLIKGVEGGLAPALNKPLRRVWADFSSLPVQQIDKQSIPNMHWPAGTVSAPPVQPGTADPVQDCLDQGIATLAGVSGVARDSLCLTVAQILHAHDRANSLLAAVEKVQDCLDNGSAQSHFRKMIVTPGTF